MQAASKLKSKMDFDGIATLPQPPAGVKLFRVTNQLRKMYQETSIEVRQQMYLDFVKKLGTSDENDERICWFKDCLRQLNVQLEEEMVRQLTTRIVNINRSNEENKDHFDISDDEDDMEGVVTVIRQRRRVMEFDYTFKRTISIE